MKKTYILIILLLINTFCIAQSIRVAILDFENISGIVKYDGLGKAMSSMLISDIEANVSPKRLQLVERAQIQKVLTEQNFQASGSVNKSTAVQTGKLLGVNYLLVGDVFVLNDQLIINARLTNTESGDIVFSQKQEGKTIDWLTLKTNIARDLATSLSQPFIEPTIPDKEVSVATIMTFGNAVSAKDSGDLQMAETLTSTILDFSPDFKYVDDLRKEIDELKKQVAMNTANIKILTQEVNENVTDYLELGYKYSAETNFSQAEKYFLIGLNKVNKGDIVDYLNYILALSELYYNMDKYMESLKYSEMGLEVYPFFKEFLNFKYMSLAKLNRLDEFDEIVKTANEIQKLRGDSLVVESLKKFSEKNGVNYYTIEKYLEWEQDVFNNLIKAIRFKPYVAFYGEYGGEFYFNDGFSEPFNVIAVACIQEVYNEKPVRATLLLNQLDLSNSSAEVKFSVAWYTMLSADFTKAQKQWDEIVIHDFWQISDCAEYGITKMVKAGNLKNSVQSLWWVYDKKNGILYQDSIRKYHPDGTITVINLAAEKRDSIRLKGPHWYYEYDDGRGFVTLSPIKAYVFKVNLQFPFDAIIDCIKSSGCINWSSVSESNKMALINWGHSYMLSGETSKAIKIYDLFPSDFTFSEDFNHMTYLKVLKSDWSDFVKSGLVSKVTIDKIEALLISKKN